MKKFSPLGLLLLFLSAAPGHKTDLQSPYVLILGTAQDGGHPQAGCLKECCKDLWSKPAEGHLVSCIAVVDPLSKDSWIFDCTPDFPKQLQRLNALVPTEGSKISGILLTHAHIGHYAGLMHLGREVMGAKEVKVWAMPKMKNYLETNGPWSQLVKLQNIALQPLKSDSAVKLNGSISVTPFLVPHRDEYSETAGFRIQTASRSVVFIPDIDKWSKWTTDIREVIRKNDLVLIDGTFFQEGEIGRSMAEVPHPFIKESMELFKDLPEKDKAKVYFIHLNHTNPALKKESGAQKEIKKQGFNLAEEGQKLILQ